MQYQILKSLKVSASRETESNHQSLKVSASRETESNRRPKDVSLYHHYSPPLYQLSYHGPLVIINYWLVP